MSRSFWANGLLILFGLLPFTGCSGSKTVASKESEDSKQPATVADMDARPKRNQPASHSGGAGGVNVDNRSPGSQNADSSVGQDRSNAPNVPPMNNPSGRPSGSAGNSPSVKGNSGQNFMGNSRPGQNIPSSPKSNGAGAPNNKNRGRPDAGSGKQQLTKFSPTGRVGTGNGDKLLEISGKDMDGRSFKLSDYQGKVIMVDFWGDW